MSRGTFIFALLLVVLIVGIVAMKSNGAVDHPILVDASVSNAAAPQDGGVVIPWQLNTRCSINSRNLPTRDPERNA